MLVYPELNPIAFSIGPISIYWYGITYLFGFVGCFALAAIRLKKTDWKLNDLADLLFYIAVGIIFGGRIGYIVFYHPSLIITDPLSLFTFWSPGRSFHGGFLGVLLSLGFYCKFKWKKFLQITDFIAPVVPIGLGCGRLGNFINGELWGRITDVPWGMRFSHVGVELRHASQLYELILEGVVLCIFLLWYARKPRNPGVISGMFLIGYGVARILSEFFREPDLSHGFIAFQWLTMGQLLCIPMILYGMYLITRKVEI